MPKSLLARCGRTDTIGSFRRAVWRRYADGLLAFESGDRDRRTAAVYLWGYSVEMTVKAAVFRAKGHSDTQPMAIAWKVVNQLTAQASGVGLTDLHAVNEWAALLVAGRAVWPTTTPLSLAVATDVRRRADEVAALWHPVMRYHGNVAYRHELARMRDHATWFIERFESL